jgi:trans-2,3-dihydro-3-hydroxyanthranilic acid synthase
VAGIPAIAPYSLPRADELPDNTATWKADPGRAVLLVHDMQPFFLRPLPDSPRAQLIDTVAGLVDRARAVGVPVAYTAQPGGMTTEERGLLKDFWGPGMRADPADRAVVDPLAPVDGDWLLTKWRYSAFFRSGLLARMREAGRDQLVASGVYAHVGVLMSAVEAFTNDIETFLVGDAVADFSLDHHRMALDYAAGRCAVVAPAEEMFR